MSVVCWEDACENWLHYIASPVYLHLMPYSLVESFPSCPLLPAFVSCCCPVCNMTEDSELGSNEVLYRTLWHHNMQTFSALLASCKGNPPVTIWFPSKWGGNTGFDVFFDVSLNKLWNKQLICQWFEVPWCLCDFTVMNKQRVLMHAHQGRNVRHGLCHIYMRYVYIYELFIAFVSFVVCSLL